MNNISDLVQDNHNPRRHTLRNIQAITKSLENLGAARSIVIDEDNNIICGNGLVDAASIVGIEKVQIVEADGNTIIAVRRSNLTDDQKKQLAVFDNRTGELAEWDAGVLSDLITEGVDLSAMFTEAEQAILFEEAPPLDLDIGDKPLAEAKPRGDAVLRYDLIFEDHEQQERFHAFLRELNARYPEAETIAARLDMFISATLYEGD